MTTFNSANTDPIARRAKSIIEGVVNQVPLRRIGHVEDVSNLVSFLVSRNSDCTSQSFLPWLT